MEFEALARKAAADRLSKSAAAKQLGYSRYTFDLLLSTINPPIEWPARGQSVSDLAAAARRRGVTTAAQVVAMNKANEERRSHTLDGRTGTIPYLAQFYPVSSRTIYRRMKSGMTLAEAVKP